MNGSIDAVRRWLRTDEEGRYKLGLLSFDGEKVTQRDLRFRVTFKLLWFDLWVGVYFDRKQKQLYICPFPCCVFQVGYQ